MDEVFGKENFVALINFKTMMPLESGDIESVYDYLCWYSRDKEQLKYRNLYVPKKVGEDSEFVFADTGDNGYRRLTREEIANFEETAECQGHALTASVAADGKFTVTNGRNGFSKTYMARKAN